MQQCLEIKLSRDQVRTVRVLVQHENEFRADMTVTKEALATSEPGAVATGQTLTFIAPIIIPLFLGQLLTVCLECLAGRYYSRF